MRQECVKCMVVMVCEVHGDDGVCSACWWGWKGSRRRAVETCRMWRRGGEDDDEGGRMRKDTGRGSGVGGRGR